MCVVSSIPLKIGQCTRRDLGGVTLMAFPDILMAKSPKKKYK